MKDRQQEAIEHQCYIGNNGTFVDEDGHEYRDEDGECVTTEGLNTCDKCGEILESGELVWIHSDDFTPKENEIVTEEMYKKYVALCEWCYLESINFNERN